MIDDARTRRSAIEYHDELVDAVRRVFLHVLGLDGERPGAIAVDEDALQQFVLEVLGAPGSVRRPPLLVRTSGTAVRPDDAEDLVHAYLMAGRLVLERSALNGRPAPTHAHVDTTCSAWAADHLQAAAEVVSIQSASQVAVCAACIAVYEHHGAPAACPACGTLLIVRPLREVRI
jgi:predicted RNA-binding Zn-ribbon protein involved in translation (DUF1610 family)